eukprot:m.142866 g.142866  ORF g.142866 m.142866 type:complete len:77 (-) comp16723_c0_seq1:274-504(-)
MGDNNSSNSNKGTDIPSFGKGVLAGALLANFNKQLMLGVMLGAAAGIYYHQEFKAPDVGKEYERLRKIVMDAISSK